MVLNVALYLIRIIPMSVPIVRKRWGFGREGVNERGNNRKEKGRRKRGGRLKAVSQVT